MVQTLLRSQALRYETMLSVAALTLQCIQSSCQVCTVPCCCLCNFTGANMGERSGQHADTSPNYVRHLSVSTGGVCRRG